MNDYWNARLEQFRQAPIVDIFGVVLIDETGGSSNYEEPDIRLSSFAFGAWRVGTEEVQLTLLRVTFIAPQSEVERVGGYTGLLRQNGVVHIKAHIIENEFGYKEALYVEWVGAVANDQELKEIHRQLTQPITLDFPPLPPFRYQKWAGWTGEITLRSWATFCPFSEPFYERPDGQIPLDITTEDMPLVRLGYKGVPPTPVQVAAYSYLVENDEAVRYAVLQAIFEQYPQWQEEYGGDPEYMPDVTHPMQFKSLIALWNVSIMRESRDDFAYVYLDLISGGLIPRSLLRRNESRKLVE